MGAGARLDLFLHRNELRNGERGADGAEQEKVTRTFSLRQAVLVVRGKGETNASRDTASTAFVGSYGRDPTHLLHSW